MSTIANILIGTLVLGGVYALIALGFVFIYRSTGLINFAHGQMLAIGAWIALVLMQWGWLGVLAALIACAFVGALAGLTYLGIVRPVESHGLFVAVIATMGVAFMLDGAMPILFGTAPQSLPLLPDGALSLGEGVGVTWSGLSVFVLSMVLYIVVVAADRKFLVGVQMRASAADKLLASHAGIRVNRTFWLAWSVAGVLAAAAGMAYASTSIVSQDLVAVGLAGLPAALVGGFDSLEGTLPGALLVALAMVLASTYLGAAASFAATYAVLLVFLMVKPEGLFGMKTVERV